MPAGERILVVDDDASLRRFLVMALEHAGFRVDGAGDGEGARRLIAGATPAFDAVLLDALLPDVRGAELARQLIASPPTSMLPVCFFSGALRGGRGGLPARAGVSCIPKPAVPERIVGQLEALIGWARRGGSPAAERRAALLEVEQFLLI